MTNGAPENLVVIGAEVVFSRDEIALVKDVILLVDNDHLASEAVVDTVETHEVPRPVRILPLPDCGANDNHSRSHDSRGMLRNVTTTNNDDGREERVNVNLCHCVTIYLVRETANAAVMLVAHLSND